QDPNGVRGAEWIAESAHRREGAVGELLREDAVAAGREEQRAFRLDQRTDILVRPLGGVTVRQCEIAVRLAGEAQVPVDDGDVVVRLRETAGVTESLVGCDRT